MSDAGSGVKSLKVSPDGKHLAAGNRNGNLWYVSNFFQT